MGYNHLYNTFFEEDVLEQIQLKVELGKSGLGNSALSLLGIESNHLISILQDVIMERIKTVLDSYFLKQIDTLPEVMYIANNYSCPIEINVKYFKTNCGWFIIDINEIKLCIF